MITYSYEERDTYLCSMHTLFALLSHPEAELESVWMHRRSGGCGGCGGGWWFQTIDGIWWNDVYNLYNQYVIHHMSCSRLLLEKQTASKCFWSICGKLWNYKYNTLPTWLECKGKMLYMLISGFLCWINMMFAFSQWRSQDLYLKYRRTNLPMFFLVCKLCVYRNCFGYCHRWNMLLPSVQLLQTACR